MFWHLRQKVTQGLAEFSKTFGGKGCLYIMPIQDTFPCTSKEFEKMPKAFWSCLFRCWLYMPRIVSLAVVLTA